MATLNVTNGSVVELIGGSHFGIRLPNGRNLLVEQLENNDFQLSDEKGVLFTLTHVANWKPLSDAPQYLQDFVAGEGVNV